LHLINRTQSKAEEVAAEIGRRHPAVKTALSFPGLGQKVDLLINATSLGLQPGDNLPFDTARFSLNRAGAVYDMVYRPAETPLLAAARKAGCRAANGLGMLLFQGARALELWTGQPAPIEIMRRALERNIYG
jgi:shikimate dehydrogenase